MTNRKGTSSKQIMSNIAWMLFDKCFILILNLLVTVRIANYYGTLRYGTYQYAVSVVALFEILISFIDARVVKKYYNLGNPGKLTWNATIARILFSVMALVGGFVYLSISVETQEYDVIFLILLINSVITTLRFGMQNRYEYLLKSRKVIIASNIALTIGGILQLLAISINLPILVIAIITAFSSYLSLIIVYFQYRADYGKLAHGTIDIELIKSLVHESFPLAIATSCAIIYSRCDSIMIGNLLSKKEVGIYAIAVKLISIVQIALIPVRESVYPNMINLYHVDKKQYERRYIKVTSLLTWIYIVGVLASYIILPYAFQFVMPEYGTALSIYHIYVWGTFFMYSAGLRAGHYTLIGRGNILMYSQLISVGLNIVLNFVLIKAIGMYGAAIATVITQGISLFLSNLFWGDIGREVFIWQLKSLNPVYIFKY